MIRILVNSLIAIGLFLITVISIFFSIASADIFGSFSSNGLSLITVFVLLSGLTWFSLTKLSSRLHFWGVMTVIVVGVLFALVPKAMFSTIKYSYKVWPFYLSVMFGVMAGLYFFKGSGSSNMKPTYLALFPLLMALGPYDLWIHKIEYGNFFGKVAVKEVIPFEFTNKAGEIVNNESLKGSYVLFDYWFIACGPCWVKFPELQKMYEEYESNPEVQIYAVNRPMRSDKPGALFSRIEDRNYTFPVLAGTQETLDALGIYKYPTVMLLNPEGEIVFMGELEKAHEYLKNALSKEL